ncbi:MAG: HPr kinase/phosphatase C-terminal domain-containing protein [Alphaproteobacteria bacterium]|jgi:serine kinase of HPr protein (carbohydrate metabolism regulator)|nr:HPr kinase/phosphatase C-terminal domain-containing protein [Alphaproteobacteria bacterium]
MTFLTLHGTAVEIQGKAVLLTGKPGMGKSSLALQLIDRGARLVADDQTCLILDKEEVYVSCPNALKGLLEVRGVGICPFPSQNKSPLSLVVEICELDEVLRLPDPTFIQYHNIPIPSLKLAKYDPLGALKVELKMGKENA